MTLEFPPGNDNAYDSRTARTDHETFMRILRDVQAVADAPHRLDEIRMVAAFFSQAANDRIDDVAAAIVIVPPHLIQQLFA